MYSISTRANSVFFFFVIGLVILSAFNILTTFFHNKGPEVSKFEITKFTSLYNHPYTRVQHSVGLIDMDIDFSPCFNWNSNLVFAWITASYKTGKKDSESVVTIWDNIMLRNNTHSHIVSFTKKMFEYPIIDTFKTLSGKEVKFELNWEHMPVIGPILKHKVELGSFRLPEKTTQVPNYSVLAREVHYDDDEADE